MAQCLVTKVCQNMDIICCCCCCCHTPLAKEPKHINSASSCCYCCCQMRVMCTCTLTCHKVQRATVQCLPQTPCHQNQTRSADTDNKLEPWLWVLVSAARSSSAAVPPSIHTSVSPPGYRTA